MEPGTRVIARRKQIFQARRFNQDSKRKRFQLFKKKNSKRERFEFIQDKAFGEAEFFAGVISNEYRHRDGLEYLVFFDNAHAQYVDVSDILIVNDKPGINCVPENIKHFYDYYFNAGRTLRRKADCKVNESIYVHLNGDFQPAIVRKFCGSSIILIEFEGQNYFEWIFEGSARIKEIHDSIENYLSKKDAESQAETIDKQVPRI